MNHRISLLRQMQNSDNIIPLLCSDAVCLVLHNKLGKDVVTSGHGLL